MEEFLAGEDGEDKGSGEVEDLPTTPSSYTLPLDDILRAFIRSVQLEPQPVVKQPVTTPPKSCQRQKEVKSLQRNDPDFNHLDISGVPNKQLITDTCDTSAHNIMIPLPSKRIPRHP